MSNRQDNNYGAKSSRDWQNPLNKMIWQRAWKLKQATVTLRDGREFTCDYETRPGHVYVQPVDTIAQGARSNLVPCGWFDLDTVLRKEWVTSD
jgi:hypothetical protein